MGDRLLLRVREVAQTLGIPVSTAYRLAAKGDLPTIRLPNGTIRIRYRDLEAWIDQLGNDTMDGGTSSECFGGSIDDR